MMVRTEPKAELTLRSLATLVIGIIGLSAATFAAASSSDTSRDIGDVMHRAQSEQTARGFENLLGTLGAERSAGIAAPAAAVMPVSKSTPANLPAKTRAQNA